jgi:hypothetical protein
LPPHPHELLKKLDQNFNLKIAAVNVPFTAAIFGFIGFAMLKFLPRFFQKAGGVWGETPN